MLSKPEIRHEDRREPGAAGANACFGRQYARKHLSTHPDQNVTDMLAYVSKSEGPDSAYSVSLRVRFRQLNKPFNVSGSCGLGADGKSTLGCGIDCDGGSLSVRIKNEQSLLVEIPDSVRLYDPSASDDDAGPDLPKAARFGSDDKLFRLDRADLKACLGLVFDEDIKAKILSGEIRN